MDPWELVLARATGPWLWNCSRRSALGLRPLCCCLVVQLGLTLCHPTDCGTPGLPVFHHLPELAQAHVHWVSGVINHLVLCLPLLLPSIFLSIGVFSNEWGLCIRWAKYWSVSISPSNEYSDLISLRIDWFDLLAVQGTLKSLTPQFKTISSSVFSFLYGPTLTSIPNHWENHSFVCTDLH